MWTRRNPETDIKTKGVSISWDKSMSKLRMLHRRCPAYSGRESISGSFWVLPNLLKQTRRSIFEVSGDGAYDTRACHAAIKVKGAVALVPPREGAAFWERGHPRNLAVGCQKLYGSNKYWKERYGYHKRSFSETAMYRVKQLLGGRLSLRNYNAQVGETYAMIKALNKLTGLGMPETCRID
ncbi:Mobile element protein [Vibrio cyclitrophicus]|nr:Mobile element protein [Vibrio cyclitrophicus]